MCANYIPVTSAERLLQFFGVVRGIDEPMREVFPAGLAPFIRLAPDGTDSTMCSRSVADRKLKGKQTLKASIQWRVNLQDVFI